ncbi:MAG: putative fatty acyl coA reductase [Frankiales bacterium]|nr:putative fatty acyl coA reductase [Frankiales bacterium]
MRLAERLAGRHVLLTGATGFVGEALLERVLADLPDTRVTVVVRGRPGEPAEQRVVALLLKPAFAALRERDGAEAVAGLVGGRLQVVDADLGGPLPPLPGDVDVLVHCAGEVSFDPPIDEGFRTNLTGTLQLLEALRAGGSRPHVVHVSTAYVAGLRSGWVPEDRHTHTVDWRTEGAAAQALGERADLESREPAVLAELLAEARKARSAAGPQAVATEAERLRLRWARTRLVEAGRERARTLGWADCYTLTKALAERAVEEACADWGVPLSVVRPSIIESALERPAPGWIEGFKMAEPVILAYGQGLLPDFPAAPEAAIDVVPVDVVVGALVAAAASPPPVGEPAWYQVGSSARNPLRFADLYGHVRTYFSRHPLPERGRGHHAVPVWDFAGGTRLERRLRFAERGQGLAERALGALPSVSALRPLRARLEGTERQLRSVRRLSDLYQAYTQAELVYADDNVLALHQALDPTDRALFGCDVAVVDWEHYLVDLHCPSITGLLRWGAALPPRPRPVRTEAVPDSSGQVVAAFDMDGTLLPSTVVEALAWVRLADAPPGRWPRELVRLAADLPRLASAERHSRAGVVRAVTERYAGADVEALAALVDERVGSEVLSRLSPAAVRVVRAHRAAGHRTVLVTGALDVFTRPLAPLFDEVLAAQLDVGPDGTATGRLVASPVVGEARAAWLQRRTAQEGWDLSRSAAYADSLSDLPMLQAVGLPVAVNPDAALAKVARREKWPVEHWASTPGRSRFALAGAGR